MYNLFECLLSSEGKVTACCKVGRCTSKFKIGSLENEKEGKGGSTEVLCFLVTLSFPHSLMRALSPSMQTKQPKIKWSGTTSLLRHLKSDHECVYLKDTSVGREEASHAKQKQTTLDRFCPAARPPARFRKPADKEELLRLLEDLVVKHDLPFNFVSWPELHALLIFLEPGTPTISPQTLKREICKHLEAIQRPLEQYFARLSSKVCSRSILCSAAIALLFFASSPRPRF